MVPSSLRIKILLYSFSQRLKQLHVATTPFPVPTFPTKTTRTAQYLFPISPFPSSPYYPPPFQNTYAAAAPTTSCLFALVNRLTTKENSTVQTRSETIMSPMALSVWVEIESFQRG